MGTYTIGEVAARTGFPATALRYYEGIGLVSPAGRTAAGYRLYDEATIARLAFIARAKQLGCTLEEIGGLVEVWDGERCAPVQRRLHALVTAKLGATDQQVAELTAFRRQLRAAADQLGGEPIDGPCAADCACLHDGSAAIACTLGADDLEDRLEQWARLLALAQERTARPTGGVRLEFAADVDVASLARLVVAEQACCAFLGFAITVDERGVGLEIDAPAEAADVVAAMFAGAG